MAGFKGNLTPPLRLPAIHIDLIGVFVYNLPGELRPVNITELPAVGLLGRLVYQRQDPGSAFCGRDGSELLEGGSKLLTGTGSSAPSRVYTASLITCLCPMLLETRPGLRR